MGGDSAYAIRVTVPARIDSGPQGTTYQGGSPIVRIHALGISSGREAFYLQTITSQFGGSFRPAR